MVEYTNDCIDCGLPCLYDSCPYYKVKHLTCDRCSEETEELYEVDGEQLCEDCLLKEFPKIILD